MMELFRAFRTATRVVGRSGYYMTYGMLSKRAEAKEFLRAVANGIVDFRPAAKPALPLRTLNALCPGLETLEIPMRILPYQVSELPWREYLCMTALLHYLKPVQVFEFGTNRGRTTRLIAERTPPGARIVTLDLPPEGLRQTAPSRRVPIRQPGEAFHGLPVEVKITQLLGDSRAFDYRPYHGAMDLIFVDAGHAYENVASDTAHALQMIAPGGVVIWDDYHPAWPGVMRCVEELAAAGVEIVHVAGTRFAYYRHATPRGAIGDTIPITSSNEVITRDS